MQAPGILSLHAMTFTNAIHYAWHRVRDDELRRLLLLQNAAFLPLFRGDRADKGIHIDALEPLAPAATGDEAVAEIFAEISKDRLTASRKILGFLKSDPDPKRFATPPGGWSSSRAPTRTTTNSAPRCLKTTKAWRRRGATGSSPRVCSICAVPATRTMRS